MRLAPDPASLPTGRGRKALIALLILLLVLLPLYLWPLRGGISDVRGASAVSGGPRDPRNPAAVAGIPGDVWDALMERGSGGSSKRARNLTMITQHHVGAGPDAIDVDGSPSLASGGSHFGVLLNDDASSGGPVHVLTSPSSDNNQGTGNGSPGFGSGGYAGLPIFGPWNGGGPGGGGGGGSPRFVSFSSIFDPGDPGVAAPTPEPATIVLLGSNAVLFGAAVLRRRRRRRETVL
jgi:PEP-CTERM motif